MPLKKSTMRMFKTVMRVKLRDYQQLSRQKAYNKLLKGFHKKKTMLFHQNGSKEHRPQSVPLLA